MPSGNRSSDASLPVRRPGAFAVATAAGRHEIRTHAKQDRQFRIDRRQLELDRLMAEASIDAAVALGARAIEGVSVAEYLAIENEVRSTRTARAFADMEPTAIPEIARHHQTASMHRTALQTAIGNVLIARIRD